MSRGHVAALCSEQHGAHPSLRLPPTFFLQHCPDTRRKALAAEKRRLPAGERGACAPRSVTARPVLFLLPPTEVQLPYSRASATALIGQWHRVWLVCTEKLAPSEHRQGLGPAADHTDSDPWTGVSRAHLPSLWASEQGQSSACTGPHAHSANYPVARSPTDCQTLANTTAPRRPVPSQRRCILHPFSFNSG